MGLLIWFLKSPFDNKRDLKNQINNPKKYCQKAVNLPLNYHELQNKSMAKTTL